MQRIGTDGGVFIDGNPATSTQGTVVTGDWLNSVQEELARVVEGFGETLSAVDNGQIETILLSNFAKMLGGSAQSWQDLRGSRVKNITYTNTTGRPIYVAIVAQYLGSGPSSCKLLVDELNVANFTMSSIGDSGNATLSGIVPNGSTYIFNAPSHSIIYWSELR